MSKVPIAILTLALTSATLAGCINAEDEVIVTLSIPELGTLIDLTHAMDDGHTLAAEHAVATANMALMGYTNLGNADLLFDTVDGNAEVSYHDGYAYVATLGRSSGFAIVDVSDPMNLQVVGQYSNPNVYSPDVKVTGDGKYAILSSHPGSTTSIPSEADPIGLPSLPRITDPLAYQEENHVTGVSLVDISDKTNPTLVASYTSEPNGVHNTVHALIDGRDIIFSVDRNNVAVLEIVDTPAGVQLQLVSEIFSDKDFRETLPDKAGSTNYNDFLPQGSHDVFHEIHPISGDHLVYIPFGRAGFFIYNVNNPDMPSMVSHWKELPAGEGYYHYARPLANLVEDKHYTIVAPEIFAGETTGTLAILDTTNPRTPQLVTEWVLPGDELLIEKNYRFSPHNFDIDENNRLYLANYHAGVIVLDLGCPGCIYEPAFDGIYLPHEDPARLTEDGEVICSFWCERPMVWGVVKGDDGHLYASDVESGLYALHFEPTIMERAGGLVSAVEKL